MTRRILPAAVLAWLMVFQSNAAADEPAPVWGSVIDAASHAPLEGAHVVVRETGRAAATGPDGRFSLPGVRPGLYTLIVRHLAYATVERSIRVPHGDAGIVVLLQPGLLHAPEVVVRSTRTGVSAEDSPMPVAVVTGLDLAGAGAVSVTGALEALPGVALVSDGPWATTPAVRGMSRSGVVALIDETRVEASTDIAGPLSLLSLHDLERIEVVKGPASSLDGTGALGGSVHFMSKRPTLGGDPSLHATLTTDLASVNGSVGQHVALEAGTGWIAGRFSGSARRAGDMRTPGGILPHSQFRDFSLSGAVALATMAGQSLHLSYQRGQAEDAGLPGGAPIAPAARATFTLARRDLASVEYRIPAVDPLVPLILLRASRQSIERNVEIVQSPALTLTPHAVHTTHAAYGELRLLPATGLLVTAGIDLWQRELDSRRERHLIAAGQIIGERPLPVARMVSGGVFAQGEWNALPGLLSAVAGVRYDAIRVGNDEVRSPEYLRTGNTVQVPAPGARLLWPAGGANDASWSANAGLRVMPARGIGISLLCATAFRSPSLEERFDFIDLGSAVRLGNPHLRPEQSFSINAALDITAGTLDLHGDLFLNSLRELVVEQPGTFEGRPAYIRANVGKARLYGYELEIAYRPGPWSRLSASLAFVRGEDRILHTPLPSIPPLEGRCGWSVGSPALGTVDLGLAWAARQGNPGGDERATPGFVVLDAGVASAPVAICGVTFTTRAGVRNILDRDYRLHLSTLRGVVRSEPGRNLWLSLTVAL